MLDGMDMPWLVLGVVLGLLLVLLAGLATATVLRRRAARPRDGGPTALGEDDLPGFLESPPGAAPAAPAPGWAVLAPVAAPTRPAPPRHRRGNALVVVAAMAGTALLLVGLVAAVAGVSRPDDRRAASSSPSPSPARGGTDARLTFGGVVLEPRAVGVTATYPVVEVSSDGDLTRARIRFPTFNCLSGEAPADPVAAGCTPTPTEYAELASPDLAVADEGDGFALRGRFPTETHPNGSPPEPTDRTYELRIAVTPAGPPGEDGWRPARGVLELGPGRATTVDRPGVSELRSGS